MTNLDVSNLDFENLTENKIDKFIKKRIKRILKREEEIREWILKFFTDKWYKEELNRILEFESIADSMEGFENEPVIKRSYRIPDVNGKGVLFEYEPPDVDRSKIRESIQRVIPKYSVKIKRMLERAKGNLESLNIHNLEKDKDILKIIIEKFKSYWEYLGYLRDAYVEIFNAVISFKSNLTVKFVLSSIVEELYHIDEQNWYRDRIFGIKKLAKLLDGNL